MEKNLSNNWKVVSQETLLDHPRIKVVEDTILLPSGETTDYVRFEGDLGASTLIIVNSEEKILVQREFSYPLDATLYQFPGGGIGRDETPEQAALREMSEEANLTGDLSEIGWFYVDNRRKTAKMHIFVAHNLSSKTGQLDPEEELEEFWLSESEIDDLIVQQKLVIYSALATWAVYKNYVSQKIKRQ